MPEQKHEIMMERLCEKELPWEVEKRFSHDTCCNLEVALDQENWWKMELNALGDFGQIFWDFCWFWKDCFFDVFRSEKSQDGITTNQVLGGLMGPKSWLWTPSIIQGDHLYCQILADSTFSYLTTPDAGQCRQMLAPTGFWRGWGIWVFLKQN